MLIGFGWAVIQASRSCYVGAPFDQLDALDEELKLADQALRAACRTWLEQCDDPWFRWQFTDHLNNHTGLLQFHTSRNHRAGAVVWTLSEYIARQSKGSFGVLHVHDDEDSGGRLGAQNFSQSFRIWRILDGVVSEHADPLFSPFQSPHAFGGKGGFGEQA